MKRRKAPRTLPGAGDSRAKVVAIALRHVERNELVAALQVMFAHVDADHAARVAAGTAKPRTDLHTNTIHAARITLLRSATMGNRLAVTRYIEANRRTVA